MSFHEWGWKEWAQVILSVIVIAAIIWILTACAGKQVESLDIIWIENADCAMIAEGLSAKQAQQMSQDFEFADCGISVGSEQTSEGKKKQ